MGRTMNRAWMLQAGCVAAGLLGGIAVAETAVPSAPRNPHAMPPAVVRYDGHKVAKVTVHTAKEYQTVMALQNDIWNCAGAGIGTFVAQFDPQAYMTLVGTGIEHELWYDNVQLAIDAERARLEAAPPADASWFDDYKNYDAVKAYSQSLAANNPTLVKYEVVGKTQENREIFAMRITGPGPVTNRPAILIQGTQHAREWVSPMTVMYIADQLAKGYASDPSVKKIMDSVEIVVIPIMNPDGYVFSWGPDRMWRKNRKLPPTGSNCFGVDINRNWGYKWGGDNGSSPDPCNDTYRGKAPFSELETLLVSNYTKQFTRLKAAIDYHSFSQLVLSPWGWTDELPPDHPVIDAESAAMSAAIKAVHGKEYVYGPGYTTIYPTTGGVKDWWFGELKSFGWTIELRDEGQFGFILPPSQIIPTAEENWPAFKHLCNWVRVGLVVTLQNIQTEMLPDTPLPVSVKIANGSGKYEANSATLYWRVSGTLPFTSVPMTSQGNGLYGATVPGTPCGKAAQFYIEAKTLDGGVVRLPEAGPNGPFGVKAIQYLPVYTDTLETGAGWTVGAAGDKATTGIWNRQDPQGTIAQPEFDHTPGPAVNCFVTDGGGGNFPDDRDVDGGSTTLTSGVLNASGLGDQAFIGFWLWYSNDKGQSPGLDPLVVQLSNNNGSTWTTYETITKSTNAWVQKQYKVSDKLTPSSTMRLRIIATDNAPDSLVEAAIDDIFIATPGCPAPCVADCDGSGILNIEDIICFQTRYAIGDSYADCDGNGFLNIDDFICFQTLFALGC